MRLSLACLVAFLGTASAMVPIQALGTVIDVALDPSKFGKLDQAKTACPDTNCGPTAAVNSLVYLQNVFPTTYKVPLVPSGKEVDTANILSGKNFMGTCCVTGGAEIGDFILGKMAYIEIFPPALRRPPGPGACVRMPSRIGRRCSGAFSKMPVVHQEGISLTARPVPLDLGSFCFSAAFGAIVVAARPGQSRFMLSGPVPTCVPTSATVSHDLQ